MGSTIRVMQVPEPSVAVGEDPRTLRAADVGCLRRDDGRRACAGATARGDRRFLAADARQGRQPESQAPPVVETGALEMLRRSSGLMAVLDEISRGWNPLSPRA